MKYIEFIEIVRNKLMHMNEEEKTNWIYEHAKMIESSYRETFIQGLEHPNIKRFDEDTFVSFISDINEQNIYIKAYEEDYFDEYEHDWCTELKYTDPFGIGNTLTKYIYQAYEMIYDGNYLKACSIFQSISELNIYLLADEDGESEEITFKDLHSYELIDIDQKEFYRNYIFAAYRAHQDCKIVFNIMKESSNHCFSFIDALISVPDDLDEFLYKWINYLKFVNDEIVADLLIEACLYLKDIDLFIEVSRDCYKIHPSLYKAVVQYFIELNKMEEARKIGIEAIHKIGVEKIIRSDIANMLIPYFDNDEYLISVAFLSNPTGHHCFRAIHYVNDLPKLKNEFQKLDYTYKGIRRNELEEAYITENMVTVYCFLLGDYIRILKEYIINTKPSNASYSIKENLIPFILLLLKADGIVYKADDNIFNSILHILGYNIENKLELLDYFYSWKKQVYLTPEIKKDCISWLENEIEKSAEINVGGGRKRHYDTVANNIIVFAQILYQEGNIENIESYINKYKKLYLNKRIFKSKINEGLMMCF